MGRDNGMTQGGRSPLRLLKISTIGLLNISLTGHTHVHREAAISRQRGMFKHVVQPPSRVSRGKGHSYCDARSVHSVRERARREERQVCAPEGGKMARTPLAAFFNIPGEVVSTPFLHQHFTPSPLNPPTRGEELETKGRKATTVIKHDTGGALSLKSMAS